MCINEKLIAAIIVVESGGNDNAVGDKHLLNKAYGCMQIRQPAVDDINRRAGTRYKAQDCLGNRPLSRWMFEQYMEIYCTSNRLGRMPSEEDMARCWNGGPAGWKNPRTQTYWQKVKYYLDKQ